MFAKLFVIQVYQGDRWVSKSLYKGPFPVALLHAEGDHGSAASRVKRVKTPAELDQFSNLPVAGQGALQTEWVN